jgi:type IV pilus assembly protein PilM
VKDKQIPGIVDTQAREYFPMDVSNYTIVYRKMDEVVTEKGKNIKILLLAVPDNLLSNYCSFAENAGLSIENIEYIGNSAVSYMTSHFPENGVIVQLEEQATIISMISGKNLVFQRVAPYGYGTTLATVLDHTVLGAKDEYEAFAFLEKNDVLHSTPKAEDFPDSTIEETDRRQELLEEAYADVKDALNYHIRVVYTALDYYKNQTKGDFSGKLHLMGDGVRLAGIREMFAEEIPLQLEYTDYFSFIRFAKGGTEGEQGISPVGMLSVIGAAIAPIGVRPKELREKENKKNTLKTAYEALAASVLVSLILIVVGLFQQYQAVSEQAALNQRIEELSYIQEIYTENEIAKETAAEYQGFDNVTKNRNERFLELMEALETELPTSMAVENMSISGNSITMNVSCDTKMTTVQFLLNMGEIPFLGNVSIASMAESQDDAGESTWTFSVMADYVEPAAVQDSGTTAQDDGTAAAQDSGTAAQDDGTAAQDGDASETLEHETESTEGAVQ